MGEKDNRLAILDALANNEQLVSRFYNICAWTFPEYKDFWSYLAAEEEKHVSWIKDFKAIVEDGLASFDQDRFNLKAVNTFSDYIGQVIIQLESKELTLRSALGSAWDIENALIEKDFLKVFDSDSPELKKLLQQLSSDTSQHRSKIKSELDTLKGV